MYIPNRSIISNLSNEDYLEEEKLNREEVEDTRFGPEHASVWIYYNQATYNNFKLEIGQQIAKVCQACKCFSAISRSDAIKLVPKIASKFRNLSLINEVMFKKSSERRLEYRTEMADPQAWCNESLKEIFLQKMNISNFYNKLGEEEKIAVWKALSDKLTQSGIGLEKATEIIKKYTSSILQKRTPEIFITPPTKSAFNQSEEIALAPAQDIEAREEMQLEEMQLVDVLHNENLEITTQKYHSLFRTVIKNLQISNAGSVYFIDKRTNTLIYGDPAKELNGINLSIQKNSTSAEFSVLNEESQSLGIAMRTYFQVFDIVEGKLNAKATGDYYEEVRSACWLSDPSLKAVLGFKGEVRVVAVKDKNINEITAIPTTYRYGFIPAIISKANTIYCSTPGGFDKIDLDSSSPQSIKFCRVSTTIPLHMTLSENALIFSDKVKVDEFSTILCDLNDPNSAFSFGSKKEVLGLHSVGHTICVLHPQELRIWDVRKLDKSIHQLALPSVAQCMGASTKKLMICLSNSLEYGLLGIKG